MADDEKKAAEPSDGDERRKKTLPQPVKKPEPQPFSGRDAARPGGTDSQGRQPCAAVRPGSSKNAARTEQTGGQTAGRCSGRTSSSSHPRQTTGQGGCPSGPERAEA